MLELWEPFVPGTEAIGHMDILRSMDKRKKERTLDHDASELSRYVDTVGVRIDSISRRVVISRDIESHATRHRISRERERSSISREISRGASPRSPRPARSIYPAALPMPVCNRFSQSLQGLIVAGLVEGGELSCGRASRRSRLYTHTGAETHMCRDLGTEGRQSNTRGSRV